MELLIWKAREERSIFLEKKMDFESFTSENPKSQKANFSQKSAVSFFLSNTVAERTTVELGCPSQT